MKNTNHVLIVGDFGAVLRFPQHVGDVFAAERRRPTVSVTYSLAPNF